MLHPTPNNFGRTTKKASAKIFCIETDKIEHNPDLEHTEEIFNQSLIMLEDKCIFIVNKTLQQIGMVAPLRNRNDVLDRDIIHERQYNIEELRTMVEAQLPQLVDEQRNAYDIVMNNVANANGSLLFLDAPGGTGKTYLINLILASVRTQNNIAIAVASSGIASTLLDGGRTAHSTFKLPLDFSIVDTPMCNIGKNSGIAKALKECKLIVWDECTMTHKKALEALDRALQDIRENTGLFGGALILLAGDFRQTLPVIPKGTPADEINACLKSSHLWRFVKKLTLKTNMRVHLQRDRSAKTFAKQLLDIGDGKVPTDPITNEIAFPTHFCNSSSSIDDVISKVYPEIETNHKNHEWLCERAILAPKNSEVNYLNIRMQEMLPGAITAYKSIDTMVENEEAVHYPIEFQNSLEPPGLPPHNLNLKVGSPIIMLRNIDPPKLCNGTRLVIKKLSANIIQATILNGKSKGEDVLIPRIPMIPNGMPFNFRRLQFPVRLAFAMTINKAQGQSLKV